MLRTVLETLHRGNLLILKSASPFLLAEQRLVLVMLAVCHLSYLEAGLLVRHEN